MRIKRQGIYILSIGVGIALSPGMVHAAPLAPGDVVGVDFGPTATRTSNYTNITSTTSSGGAGPFSMMTTEGVPVDDVRFQMTTVTSNGRAFGHANAPDNWPGAEQPAIPESATTDHFFLFSFGGGNSFIDLVFSNLDTNLRYNLNAVTTSTSNGLSSETLSVVGLGSGTSSLTRNESNAGSFHSFAGLAPSAEGMISIRITHSAFNPNPAINCLTLEVAGGGGGTTINDWYTTNSLTGDDAAPDADPNKDGIPNAIAYALGIDPVTGLSIDQQGANNPIPQSADSSMASGGAVRLILPETAPADITYCIEQNCTLNTESWIEIARKVGTAEWGGDAIVTAAPAQDSKVSVTVEGTANRVENPKCFLRLRVIVVE